MDIGKMRKAAGFLLGVHDFRNLCKIDAESTKSWVREIRNLDIFETIQQWSPKGLLGDESTDSLFCLTIEGNAFLYHMIRCIISVLFMVGRGQEEPEIMLKLLDVTAHPCKPKYVMADHFPLILSDCQYSKLDFGLTDTLNDRLCSDLYTKWRKSNMELAMNRMLLERHFRPGSTRLQEHYQNTFAPRDPSHIPLIERQKGETLETIISNFQKKKALSKEQSSKRPRSDSLE